MLKTKLKSDYKRAWNGIWTATMLCMNSAAQIKLMTSAWIGWRQRRLEWCQLTSVKAWGKLHGSGRADDFSNGLARSGLTVKRVRSLSGFIGFRFEGLNPQLVYCFLFQLKIRILKPWWLGSGGGTSRVVELQRWRWISSDDRDGEGSSRRWWRREM